MGNAAMAPNKDTQPEKHRNAEENFLKEMISERKQKKKERKKDRKQGEER